MLNILQLLQDKKPATSDQFTLQLLEESFKHSETLEADLKQCQKDYDGIKEIFKVKKGATGTEYFIYTDKPYFQVLCYSKTLEPETFSEDFKLYMRVLHLQLPEDE